MTKSRWRISVLSCALLAGALPGRALPQNPGVMQTTWTSPKATESPAPGDACAWEWHHKQDAFGSDVCGPTSDWLGLSEAYAKARAWGMQIDALGRAWDAGGLWWTSCSAAKSGAGSLTLTFFGPADPPCAPRIEVNWHPRWRWYLYLDPPGHVVVAGQMKGNAQCPGVVVDATAAPALASTSSAPVQVCVGAVCFTVSLQGGGGRLAGEAADGDGGIALCELGHLSWFGAVAVDARAEFGLLNWTSFAWGGVGASDPGLEVRADCIAPYCPGTTVIEYRN